MSGKLFAQQRPYALREETVRRDIRKVAERPDEQQLLARRFRLWLEALQVHAILHHHRSNGRPEQFHILLRHHYHPAIAADGAALEALPAEEIPPRGQRAVAARDLAEQIEGDVMLHQHVAAVIGKLGVLHLERPIAEDQALFGQRGTHGGRAELVHLGRQPGGPAGLAIGGFCTSTTRAQNSRTGAISGGRAHR